MPELLQSKDKTENTNAQREDWSARSFLASPRARRPDSLVDPLIPQSSLIMLAAEPGTGKTFFSMSLALAIARGEPFLGFPVHQGGVLLIGEDAPGWDYCGIIQKLLGGEPPPASLHILANEGFRLLDAKWRARLGEYIQAHGISLVIVDTLRAVHDKDENDSAEMQSVMNDLRAISVTYGVTVLFLHHTSKRNAEGYTSEYRGSSVLHGSCDLFFRMSAAPAGGNAKVLTLRVVKGRGMQLPDAVSATLKWEKDSATIAPTGVAPEPLGLTEVILARLAKGPAHIKDLIALVPAEGRQPKTIRGRVDQELQALRGAGVVECAHEGRKLLWSLSVARKKAA